MNFVKIFRTFDSGKEKYMDGEPAQDFVHKNILHKIKFYSEMECKYEFREKRNDVRNSLVMYI